MRDTLRPFGVSGGIRHMAQVSRPAPPDRARLGPGTAAQEERLAAAVTIGRLSGKPPAEP